MPPRKLPIRPSPNTPLHDGSPSPKKRECNLCVRYDALPPPCVRAGPQLIGGSDAARTRELLLDGMIVRQPTVTDFNPTAPIAILGALRHRQKLLLHPLCTRISKDVPVTCYNPTSVVILHSGPIREQRSARKVRELGQRGPAHYLAAERTLLAWMRTGRL